ncbi:MAG: N-acetyltransferase [Gammaproteobacteria bacterium]
MMRIRVATSLDAEEIREVHLCAFPEGEKQKVSTLAVSLLTEETNPETISLVAEADGAVVGHIAFSPVTINNSKSWVGYILAPLGVKPEYQKCQIGSKLIESGMGRFSKMGVNVVFVYGDPEYYGKFGFNPDVAARYSPPCELQYPFGWQAIALNEVAFTGSAVKISCVAPLSDPELW